MEPAFLRAFIDRWLLYTGHFGPGVAAMHIKKRSLSSLVPRPPQFFVLQNIIHLLHIIHGSRMMTKNFSGALPLPCIIVIIRHTPKKAQNMLNTINIIDTKNLSILNTSQRTKHGGGLGTRLGTAYNSDLYVQVFTVA